MLYVCKYGVDYGMREIISNFVLNPNKNNPEKGENENILASHRDELL